MLGERFPWDQLEGLVGTPLRTLAEVSPFEINGLETDEVVLTISTGWERSPLGANWRRCCGLRRRRVALRDEREESRWC
jgi:hypothetical protein